MNRLLVPGLLALASLFGCATAQKPAGASAANPDKRTAIWVLGSDHLAQLYKPDKPHTDVLTPQRQAELTALNNQIERFRPDAIMVERLPDQQGRIDSLYNLYRQGKLELATLPDGRSEVYQLGFVLGKRLGLERIYCVNAPGGTSQGILHEGTNIELYQQATTQLREKTKAVSQQMQSGSLTMGQYLAFLNSPALVQELHTLVYRTPARVTNGTLKPDAMVDAAFISTRHVGAEFISVFYNRDLKIYSNIANTQMATGSKRILTIFGARHTGSLQGIFGTDPAFQLVQASKYLKQK
ncbi:DUF5694 domain-containing protein [Solirubrum puertoriconensis]|uniref:Uncharacterized protein n=1 Tax=Solirubrum puertoriconensis TaxID=1751427 RepID=A0A9X0L2V6_SOLP1|nr:DUF5694 domain-containing protein [Solirubrum puertoriconensis]KUG05841.1 hypothetical protein ASU33_00175 [Solirubrum puertoriconensis]